MSIEQIRIEEMEIISLDGKQKQTNQFPQESKYSELIELANSLKTNSGRIKEIQRSTLEDYQSRLFLIICDTSENFPSKELLRGLLRLIQKRINKENECERCKGIEEWKHKEEQLKKQAFQKEMAAREETLQEALDVVKLNANGKLYEYLKARKYNLRYTLQQKLKKAIPFARNYDQEKKFRNMYSLIENTGVKIYKEAQKRQKQKRQQKRKEEEIKIKEEKQKIKAEEQKRWDNSFKGKFLKCFKQLWNGKRREQKKDTIYQVDDTGSEHELHQN